MPETTIAIPQDNGIIFNRNSNNIPTIDKPEIKDTVLKTNKAKGGKSISNYNEKNLSSVDSKNLKQLKIIFCLFIASVAIGIFIYININNNKIEILENTLSGKNIEITDYKLKINQIMSEFDEIKNIYQKQQKELSENKIITRMQLVSFLASDVNELSTSFLEYKKDFQTILDQLRFIEENISPYIDDYGEYVEATASTIGIISGSDYFDDIVMGLEITRKYIDLINEKILQINEINKSMAKVKMLNDAYNVNNNEGELFEASNEINEVLIYRMKEVILFAKNCLMSVTTALIH